MVVADLALTASLLMWPLWTKGRSLSRLVMNALSLVVVYFLINASDLFMAADPSVARLQGLVRIVNYWSHIGLLITAIVIVTKIVVEIVKLVGRRFAQVHHATVNM